MSVTDIETLEQKQPQCHTLTSIIYDEYMSRWKPDGRRRLQNAAIELFTEQGFTATTTAAISERAGLTQRTFFRYFKDKREVLFGDEQALQETLVQNTLNAPHSAGPMQAAKTGFIAVCNQLQPLRTLLKKREQIILSSPELREREFVKGMALSSALKDVLVKRGASSAEAEIAAEAVFSLFRIAYHKWISSRTMLNMEKLIEEAYKQLATLTVD